MYMRGSSPTRATHPVQPIRDNYPHLLTIHPHMTPTLRSLALGGALLGTPAALAQTPAPQTAPAAATQPQTTIELRNGQFWEPVTNPTTAPTSDETLDRAERLVANGNNSAARKIL